VDRAENLILKTTLGQKYGDPFAPYDESAYVNQLIIDIDTQSGAIGLFEADLREGARIQLMARDNNLMIESVRQRTQEILATQSSRDPLLAFYIDCGGRTCLISGAEKEEARLLEQELPAKLPLFGFYSAVEIAPFYGRSRPLNWTGVLTLLTDISSE
jgi:small ligand-binding sensory domain FIST